MRKLVLVGATVVAQGCAGDERKAPVSAGASWLVNAKEIAASEEPDGVLSLFREGDSRARSASENVISVRAARLMLGLGQYVGEDAVGQEVVVHVEMPTIGRFDWILRKEQQRLVADATRTEFQEFQRSPGPIVDRTAVVTDPYTDINAAFAVAMFELKTDKGDAQLAAIRTRCPRDGCSPPLVRDHPDVAGFAFICPCCRTVFDARGRHVTGGSPVNMSRVAIRERLDGRIFVYDQILLRAGDSHFASVPRD